MRLLAIVSVSCLASIAAAQPAPEQPPPEQPPPAQPVPPAPPAPDQPAPPPPVETPPAVAAFEAGRALMEQKLFGEACSKFEESLKLDPDAPGTMLNLGMCQGELDHLATSLRWFRKAQVRASESQLNAAFEQAAKQKAAELAVRVPVLEIHSPNKGASITLDGTHLDAIDLARIEVDAGEHVLVMTVPGEPPVRDQLTITDGQHRRVVLKLPSKFVVVDRGESARRRAYLIGAAGLGIWALDAGLLVIAKDRYEQTDHPDTMGTWKNVARYGGTTLFLAGGVAIAGALYFYSTAPGKERVEEQRALVPIITPDGLGVAAYGSF